MKSESPIKKPETRRNVEELPSTYVAKARESEAARPRSRRGLLYGGIAVVVIAALAYGARLATFYAHHAETDDAQIEGHVFPVLPEIAGYVSEVLVDDNQAVRAGQVLVRIDARDFLAKLKRAEASFESAKAAVAVAKANVQATATRGTKTAADVRRYAALREKVEVSQQEFDAAKAAADAAAAELQAAIRRVAAAEADVAQRQAELTAAKLELSHTTLTAAAAGRITKKAVEVGQYVQAGQPVLAVVSDENLWVIANYKETQLRGIRPGAAATIAVDAYPGRVFHGSVDSIAAATGARFALLPPDNASGNFVKVVQRIPVKIRITDANDPDRPLRVGMNVTAVIDTH